MQASTQNLSVMLGSSLQGPVSGAASAGQSQAVGGEGETVGKDFLASLETSLQALADGQQSPIVPFDPAQLLAMVEHYLDGQLPAAGGNGLPLGEGGGSGADGLTPDLRDLMARLRLLLANSPAPGAAAAAALEGQSATAAFATDGMTQGVVEQRRLFDRFQLLPVTRQGGGDSDGTLLQQMGQSRPLHPSLSGSAEWLRGMNPAVAMTPGAQGGDFSLQMAKMAELKNITMTLQEGAAAGAVVKGEGVDAAALSGIGTGAQRHLNLVAGSDARPTQAFVHVPLHDPQWQSEFSNRVTWLARAGGNQNAEIRLNPANMGPIEVRIAMNDDQATITFTAQHGVVRDAIEASLPRLREMFTGSGLQLASANVSDQPLHDQRQHQQQGFGSGNGRSQGDYDQASGSGDLASPVPLTVLHTTVLADRLDLYV